LRLDHYEKSPSIYWYCYATIHQRMYTKGSVPRPYRFGYGVLDSNLNGVADSAEGKKVYFEFSDYSTSYIFYEKPQLK